MPSERLARHGEWAEQETKTPWERWVRCEPAKEKARHRWKAHKGAPDVVIETGDGTAIALRRIPSTDPREVEDEEFLSPWLRQSDRLRGEFSVLAEQWLRDTRHLSLVSKKVLHPAYFRIMGMGEAVVPLLLEELRDRPSHWFAALRATANADPAPPNANPSRSREAWLKWGRERGLID